jgi:peptidoglycan hydrolase-like protein with peptidoglycan-binding domain
LAMIFCAALTALPLYGAGARHSSAKSHATRSTHVSHGSGVAHSARATRKSRAARNSDAEAKPKRRATRHGRKTAAASAPSHRLRGQQAIDSARVTEIQQALIREHYLDGEATGNWDETTKAAMTKYQADQGWQTKLTPDSRALKKLGLGPDYSGAINAQGSSFAAPPPVSTIPSEQAAGFADASGVKQ